MLNISFANVMTQALMTTAMLCATPLQVDGLDVDSAPHAT